MIQTVTLSPVLDKVVLISRNQEKVICSAGGKGVNVSRALKIFGLKTRATGFCAGLNGKAFLNLLDKEKIPAGFVPVSGEIRTHWTVNDKVGGQVVRILPQGPKIIEADQKKFITMYKKFLTSSSWVVLSGRSMNGTSKGFVKSLLQKASDSKTVLDMSGASLIEGLTAKPFLVKPNQQEAEEVLRFRIKTPADRKQALLKFLSLGAQNVIISLAENGALGTDGRVFLHAQSPKVRGVHGVGCGDAMVAGFIAAYKGNFATALKSAVASGTASALAEVPGKFNLKEYKRILKTIVLKEVLR